MPFLPPNQQRQSTEGIIKNKNKISGLRSIFSTLLTLSAQYAQQGLCNGPVSVCPSVCLSRRSTAAAACGGFAAERRRLQQISVSV